jgi:hypothetical protein
VPSRSRPTALTSTSAPRRWWLAAALAAAVAAGCQPATSRPDFTPGPRTADAELELPREEATTRLAGALLQADIPVTHVRPRDGYLETPWFDTTGHLISGRALGSDAVRVRAWVDPAQPGHSLIKVETVYRPAADPSRPERDLEREVADSNPVARRLRAALRDLAAAVGGTGPTEPVVLARAPSPDSARKPARDTARPAPIDTLPTPLPTRLAPPAARVDSIHQAAHDTARPVVVVPRDSTPPISKPVTRAPTPTPKAAVTKPVAPQPTPAQAAPTPTRHYTVQVSAQPTQASADSLVRELARRHLTAHVVAEGKYFKVRIGSYPDLDTAMAAARTLSERLGVGAFATRERR